jgi:hypothetical protein
MDSRIVVFPEPFFPPKMIMGLLADARSKTTLP